MQKCIGFFSHSMLNKVTVPTGCTVLYKTLVIKKDIPFGGIFNFYILWDDEWSVMVSTGQYWSVKVISDQTLWEYLCVLIFNR